MSKTINFEFNNKSHKLPKYFRSQTFKLPDINGYLYIKASINRKQKVSLKVKGMRVALEWGRLSIGERLSFERKKQWKNIDITTALKIMHDWDTQLEELQRSQYEGTIFSDADLPIYTELSKNLDIQLKQKRTTPPKNRFKKLGL